MMTTEISQAEYWAIVKKRSKYSNEIVYEGGVRFDSKAEARRYEELCQLEMAGAIEDLSLQPQYELQPAFRQDGTAYAAITYYGDFSYRENGKTVIEDVKGTKTEVFKLKAKLFRYRYPDIDLRILEV